MLAIFWGYLFRSIRPAVILLQMTVQIVKSYHDDTAGAVEFALELATWIKSELQQELVSVETESGLLFV